MSETNTFTSLNGGGRVVSFTSKINTQCNWQVNGKTSINIYFDTQKRENEQWNKIIQLSFKLTISVIRHES